MYHTQVRNALQGECKYILGGDILSTQITFPRVDINMNLQQLINSIASMQKQLTWILENLDTFKNSITVGDPAQQQDVKITMTNNVGEAFLQFQSGGDTELYTDFELYLFGLLGLVLTGNKYFELTSQNATTETSTILHNGSGDLEITHQGTGGIKLTGDIGFFGGTPVAQTTVANLGSVITTQAPGATYTANEQLMLGNLRADIITLYSKMNELLNQCHTLNLL